MISPFQAPLLVSSYDKAMEAFVRLAQFDRASDLDDFKCEVEDFSIPLAHDDLIILALMLRKIVEICGLAELAKTTVVHHKDQTYTIFKLLSRIIHSTELEAHTRALMLELRDAANPTDFFIKNMDKFTSANPVVRLKSDTDGTTIFPLRTFLEKVDGIICEAVEVAASQKCFMERSIRL